MNTTEAVDAKGAERSAIVAWRFEVLLRAGYSWDCATRLAIAPDVDLHVAIGLAAADCPESTALRILL
jgi:hypothetical protein